MKNISIKGIIFAVLAVVILDTISGIALIPIFVKDMTEESLKVLSHEVGLLIFSMFFGTISTVIGGFIAAKYGKLAPYKNAAVIGVIGIILGVLLSSNYPLWFNVLALLITLPSALLGAYFVARKNV